MCIIDKKMESSSIVATPQVLSLMETNTDVYLIIPWIG